MSMIFPPKDGLIPVPDYKHSQIELFLDSVLAGFQLQSQLSDRLANASSNAWVLWMLGFPLSLVSVTIEVVGMMLMSNRRFVFGMIVFGFGGFLGQMAGANAPNTWMSCLQGFPILITLIICSYWFGESLSRTTKWCAVVLISSCVWVAFVGPDSDRVQSVDEVIFLFAGHPFVICSITFGTVFVACLAYYSYWRQLECFSLALQHGGITWSPAMVLVVCMMAQIFGIYHNVLAKCTSLSMQAEIQKNKFDIKYQIFMWMVIQIICACLYSYFMYQSLLHGDNSFVIPVLHSLSMTLQLIIGGIFFKEYESFTLTQHLELWPAVLLVLGCVALLAKDKASVHARKQPD